MDKANPVIMDSSTFGLPTDSRLGYKETIAYATKISTDGIYCISSIPRCGRRAIPTPRTAA